MIRSFLIVLGLVMFYPAALQAKGTVNVGDTIPHDLVLQDSSGKMRSFSDLKGDKGLVLVFVRSADWCPYCQKQLLELDESNEKFEEWGYEVVSISYDTPEALQKFITTNKPGLTMLSDPRSESIRAFGILNEEPAKGTRSYGIPYPGVYVIGADKKVQAKFFEEGYKDRPATVEILARIEELNPPVEPPMTVEEMGQDPIAPDEMFIETPEKIEEPVVVAPEVEEPIIIAPETEEPDEIKFESDAFDDPFIEGPDMTPDITVEDNPADAMSTQGLDPIIDEVINDDPYEPEDKAGMPADPAM